MPAFQSHLWVYFILCLTVFFITTIWMAQIAKHFYTHSLTRVSFSIFDLEFPISEEVLVKLIDRTDSITKKYLRQHLCVDFLFMGATYTGIGLLCYITALKMEYAGRYVFMILAFLQILPWLFDIAENLYLLNKVAHPVVASSDRVFKIFQFIVKAKFVIALLGAVCSIFGLLYFWITGWFQPASLIYLVIIVFEIVVFIFISKSLNKKKTA
jgi:hypothetical protein